MKMANSRNTIDMEIMADMNAQTEACMLNGQETWLSIALEISKMV